MPRPMAVRCCAVSSQGLAATLSCAAGFALCDAHCGCSGGVGSMVRVWGAMAPARFVLFLLLMAMCFRETCAAPWRAPGAGGWAEMGHGLSSSGGKKSGCVPTALCHTSLGLAFHGGWCWAGGDGQHRRSRARARGSAAPQGWLQPCRAMAAACWLEHSLRRGRCPGESLADVCWEKREHFCSRLMVLPVDESQFPTQSPGPQPRGRDRRAFLQCFSVTFLCIGGLPVRKPPGAASSSMRSVRDVAHGLERVLCTLPGASLQVILATLQLWES